MDTTCRSNDGQVLTQEPPDLQFRAMSIDQITLHVEKMVENVVRGELLLVRSIIIKLTSMEQTVTKYVAQL